MSNSIYLPYTYHLEFLVEGHPDYGRQYIGVRYKNSNKTKAHPDDLLTTYNTSSKTVKALIKEFGPQAFRKTILCIYEDAHSARIDEIRRLTEIDAKRDPMFFNKHNGHPDQCTDEERRAIVEQEHKNFFKAFGVPFVSMSDKNNKHTPTATVYNYMRK